MKFMRSVNAAAAASSAITAPKSLDVKSPGNEYNRYILPNNN
jgi:hypothetical protein